MLVFHALRGDAYRTETRWFSFDAFGQEGMGSLAVWNSELNLRLQVEPNRPRSPGALRALNPLRAWSFWHPSSSASDTQARECPSKAPWRYGQDRNTELKAAAPFGKPDDMSEIKPLSSTPRTSPSLRHSRHRSESPEP